MFRFILQKFTSGLLIIVGVAIVVFLIFQVLPGDPVAMLMGQRSDVSSKEAIEREFGLNEPTSIRLLHYLNDLSPISVHKASVENSEKYNYIAQIPVYSHLLVIKTPYMRRSFQSNRHVTDIIWEGLRGTFWLAISAMTLACIIGIFMGAIAAVKHNTWIDRVLVTSSVLGISAPSFVVATLMVYAFAIVLHDFTGFNLTGSLYEIDPFEGKQLALKNLILPTITLGIRPLAIITQLTRSSMLDVLGQDFVRTARAKGLPPWKVLIKHALRNALNPVLTAVSGWFASLLAGAFFVEYIFSWQGLGSTTINAVFMKDFPVVMGITVFIAFIFVMINLLVDFLYSMLDPRVKLG